jgi:hypothetical protein
VSVYYKEEEEEEKEGGGYMSFFFCQNSHTDYSIDHLSL